MAQTSLLQGLQTAELHCRHTIELCSVPQTSRTQVQSVHARIMDLKVVTLLLLLTSVSADTSSPWVQVASGFIAGLQRNPTTLSNCQTLLVPLATKWEAAAASVVGLEAWETLYDLRDFFTALDFWTQTCNFVTLFNYVKLNMTWNLLLTRIATNLTFYAVRNT